MLCLICSQKIPGFLCVHILGQGRADEEIACGSIRAGYLYEILMVGGISSHHGHIPAHFFFLAQQHSCFRIIACEEDKIRIGGLELGENGRIIALARSERVKEDDLDASFFKRGTGFLGKALGIGGIVVKQGHCLVAAFLDGVGRRSALGVITRAGAEKAVQAFFRKADAG